MCYHYLQMESIADLEEWAASHQMELDLSEDEVDDLPNCHIRSLHDDGSPISESMRPPGAFFSHLKVRHTTSMVVIHLCCDITLHHL